MNYVPVATSSHAFAWVGSPLAWVLLYFVIINVITFCTFGVDKWKAKRKAKKPEVVRVPEKTLFLLAILGGSPAALLGMKAFHHKTLHKTFTIGIPVILILQLILMITLTVYLCTR